jgi:hypothetical protein
MESTMSKTIGASVTTNAVMGTTGTYVSSPDPSTNDFVYVNSSESDPLLRERLMYVNRPGNVSGTVSTKRKAKASYTVPVEDATTGEIRYANIRVEISVDIRDESAALAQLRAVATDILRSNGDLDDFWLYGSE